MAEILQGGSNHKSFAPLSHGQTIALGQHLQTQIQELVEQLQDVKKGQSDTNSGCVDLRKELSAAKATIRGLEDNCKASSLERSALRDENARLGGRCDTLKAGLKDANDNIEAMRTGQKVTNTNVHNMHEELKAQSAQVTKMEKHMSTDIGPLQRSLEDAITSSKLNVEQIRDNQKTIQRTLGDHREQMRGVNEDLKSAVRHRSELSGALAQHGQKLDEMKVLAEGTKVNLEVTNAVVMNLHEDHEATKVSLASCKADVKDAGTRIGMVATETQKTTRGLDVARTDVAKLSAEHASTRDVLGQTVDSVSGLQDGSSMAYAQVQSLQQGLEHVHSIAVVTKEGLKETNSMVLPNLHMDTGASPKAMGDGSRSMRGLTPRRRPRESANHLKTIGLAPNRMAMI